jgi:hypothetical protein
VHNNAYWLDLIFLAHHLSSEPELSIAFCPINMDVQESNFYLLGI